MLGPHETTWPLRGGSRRHRYHKIYMHSPCSSAASESGDSGFQIAPMVDVVFVLMLFFMASAGMKMRELELSVHLPGAGPSISPPIVIAIDGDGRVSINEKTYAIATDRSLGELRGWLTGVIAQFGLGEPVIIRPASDTQHERIMQVLNAAAASGVVKVTFG